MKKQCTKCKLDKDISEFAIKSGNKKSLWCKKCQSEYSKKHYILNKEKYKDKAKRHSAEYRDWIDTLKDGKSCEKCGESRKWVLDFHHKTADDKLFNISSMKRLQWGKARVIEEVKKCSILCSNCHRDLHHSLS